MMDEPWAYPEVMLIWLTFLPSGEREIFAVDHVDTVSWYEIMNLLVSYWQWNQRKTYLVIDREYGTNVGVPRSGLRFFDWFRLWSTWLGVFFLPEPAPHWVGSMFDHVMDLKVWLHII